VEVEQTEVRQQLVEVQRVAATLDVEQGSAAERQAQFTRLQEEFTGHATAPYVGMAAIMASFSAGLFAGADVLASLHDNLDLERWFRLPKGHERLCARLGQKKTMTGDRAKYSVIRDSDAPSQPRVSGVSSWISPSS
jgi:hypothetical protein